MTEYKTGQNGNFFWIEFSRDSFNLNDLLRDIPSILENKYLAFDCGGPFQLTTDERNEGWYVKDQIAYSPKLTDKLIEALPVDHDDQWCFFNKPTEFSGLTCFVCNVNFTIASRRHELTDADETWDKVGLEEIIEYHEQIVEQFWKEVTILDPECIILDSDNFIFVSKNITDIEMIKKNCR